MKQFKTVFKFELANYFKTKSFVITTILLAAISAGLMFIPRIKDELFDNKKDTEVSSETENGDAGELDKVVIYDETGNADFEMLNNYFPESEYDVVVCDNADEVKSMVEDEKAVEGYVLKSETEFDMYIFNKDVFSDPASNFRDFMAEMNKVKFCKEKGIDVDEFLEVENLEITSNENILGKNAEAGYGYSYALIIIIFILIVAYGMQIASGVTNEKSNRSIEILVTSVDTNSILFGKVFAGVVAVFFQVGIIAASCLGSYQYNKEYMGDVMAMFFDIPANVLVVFAVFGIGGFLFYAFAYGALGALVSKIEDLNKSAGTAQMVITLVYMATLILLTDIDGVPMKVLSYLPVSSYSAMFARVGMGTVATWEIVLSGVILYLSVIFMGIIGGKIFRMSTLRYGNPIKLSNAIKSIRKKN